MFEIDNDFSLYQEPFKSVTVAQLVKCVTKDPGIRMSIRAQSHTFVKIDLEIISAAILPLSLIQERLLSVTSESMCRKY